MSDYDNTDSGAAFKPFPEQALILQGSVDNEGNDERIALIKTITKGGTKLIEIYEKVGVMFVNNTNNEKAPQYTGPYKGRRIAAWKKTKDNLPYMSLKLSNQQEGSANSDTPKDRVDFNDDIPF